MKMLILGILSLFSCSLKASTGNSYTELDSVVLGAGCFWCVEAIYQELNGVLQVESGYMGGSIKNPSYKEVCSGLSGHAEVVKIKFHPKLISFEEILEVFWSIHDPTTLNRQGNDVGTQYRSVIFYNSEEQRKIALDLKHELNVAKLWSDPIVTEISKAKDFYSAEAYHQNYYLENKAKNPYCSYVIAPKLEKFRKLFEDKLRKK
ncbi:MAG: peptide-methionine (S)-S-oxide reductase MsrA [Chitinophagales bacterium]|nr:peptide-methionine (S)-S-oxide reductase MsrA [Chitinophagales bacterium]